MARRRDATEQDENAALELFGFLDDAAPLNPVSTPAQPEPPPPALEPPPPSTMPEQRHILDCGHSHFHTDEQNTAAQLAGHCCAGGARGAQVHWQMLRGKYVRPLPVARRRTRESSARMGFPGYCCDDNGFYIGGLGNDCRTYRPAGVELCPAHRPASAAPVVVDEPEPEAVSPHGVEDTGGHMPAPRKKTFKERQIEARRKGK